MRSVFNTVLYCPPTSQSLNTLFWFLFISTKQLTQVTRLLLLLIAKKIFSLISFSGWLVPIPEPVCSFRYHVYDGNGIFPTLLLEMIPDIKLWNVSGLPHAHCGLTPYLPSGPGPSTMLRCTRGSEPGVAFISPGASVTLPSVSQAHSGSHSARVYLRSTTLLRSLSLIHS
jgi:hypothetical protein